MIETASFHPRRYLNPLLPLLLVTLLSGCFTSPPPSDGGDGPVPDSGGLAMLVTSPAPGAKLSGASFFSVQVLEEADLQGLTFVAGGEILENDAPGETRFRRFLIPSEFPAGELVLEATATDTSGGRTTRSITVQIVPDPPSSATLGTDGDTLGDLEVSGHLSTVTFPPGTADGSAVEFSTLTQDEIEAETGIDYESLGVTFLGAQKLSSSEPVDGPIKIASGGFGPRVQPGQAVVNYAIVDADGDGTGNLTVVNSASVAPNGDVVSDPVMKPQVGEVVRVGTSGEETVAGLGRANTGPPFTTLQQNGLSGPPGTLLTFDGQGFNPAAALGNTAIFGLKGSNVEYEAYALVREVEGKLELGVGIPPMPAGPATLRLRNQSTGLETEVTLDVEEPAPLTRPAAQTIDGYLDARISGLLNLRSQALAISQDGTLVSPQFLGQLNSLISNLAGLRSEFARAYESSDPEVQAALEGLAAALEGAGGQSMALSSLQQQLSQPLYPQLSCSEAEKVLSDALEGITYIDATLAGGACVTALITGIGAPACLFGATIFVIGTAIDYTDIVPDCGDEPRPPQFVPPGGAGGASAAGNGGGAGTILLTGMGSIQPIGGNLAGNIAPAVAPGSMSSLSTSSLSTLGATNPLGVSLPDGMAGRYRIAVSVNGSPVAFSGVADAGGYFFIPSLPAGEEFRAVAFDSQTGETRELTGIGPVQGERSFLTFDFGPENEPPFADAGSDASVKVGDAVVIDGSRSFDPDGDLLTYSWSIVAAPTGSSATLVDADTFTPSLTVDAVGSYVIELTIDDGVEVDTDRMEIVVTAIEQNSPPIADAGSSRAVSVGDLVTLDGSASRDPEGEPLSYSWSLTSSPEGSTATLAVTDSVSTTFTADLAGSYVAQLVVSDGTATNSANVTITARAAAEPIAYGDYVSGSFFADVSRTFALNGTSGDRVVLTARTTDDFAPARMTLSGPGGGVLGTDVFRRSSDDGLIFAELPATGEYLVEIVAEEAVTADFHLGLHQAAEISINTNQSGTLLADQHHFYTFVAPGHIEAKSDTMGSPNIRSSILDTSGKVVSNTNGTVAQLTSGERYLLVVEAGHDGSYTAGLAEIEPPTPVDLGSDGYGRVTIAGNVEIVGDLHYYLLPATSGDGLHLSLRQAGVDPLADGDLALQLPGSVSPVQYSALIGSRYGSPVIEDVGSKLPESGDYLVRVRGRDRSSGLHLGQYELRIDLLQQAPSLTVDDDMQQCSTADSRSLQAALFAIAPGGTVNLCEGTYREGLSARVVSDEVTVSGSGPASTRIEAVHFDPLAIEADSVTISGVTLQGYDDDTAAAVEVNDHIGATFSNIKVRPHPNQASLYGGIQGLGSNGIVEDSTFLNASQAIEMSGSENVLITRNLFQGSGGQVTGSSTNYNTPDATGATISDNTFQLDSMRSISLHGAGHLIEDNIFDVQASYGGTVISMNDLGAGPDPTSIIRRNTFTVTGSDGDFVLDLTMSGGPIDLTVEQNRIAFLNNASGGKVLRLYAVDGTALVRNNIFDGVGSYEAVLVEQVEMLDGLTLANNSLRTAGEADSRAHLILVSLESYSALGGSYPVTLVNNIFSGAGGVAIGSNRSDDFTVDGDYNLFHNFAYDYRGDDPAVEGVTSSTGGSDLTGDPVFIDDLLRVSSSSPAVDAGAARVAYPAVPTVDYDGTARPSGSRYDIGAHEQ